jgi:flagellar hook assembly protein FlgD
VARLTIHDVEGRRVATLVDGIQPAGRRVVSWDGREDSGAEAASGIYFTRLESAGETRVQKIQLLR